MTVATAQKPTTRTVEWVRPSLYPKQEAAIFCPERRAVIEASTKSGKTIGCMAWILERAFLGPPHVNHWWTAPVYGTAAIAFRRLKRAIPRDLYVTNETLPTMTLANGAVIWFKGCEKPDHLYGEDVYSVVIDEATRTREEAWHALRTTITATRGPVRIIGNVRGRKNWAYKMARRAEADPKIHYARITAWDAVEAGVLDRAEIQEAREDLPDDVFRELYLAEATEDGANPFGMAAIADCVGPLSPDPVVAWGWDLAKSTDWTVGVGLDERGRVCRFERFQESWNETKADIRRIMAADPAPGCMDETGVGSPVVEDLQTDIPRLEGVMFTPGSKQTMMGSLAMAIQDGSIMYPDGIIRSELEDFQFEYTRTGVRYAAPDGMWDDCVDALALANRALTTPSAAWGAV